MDTVRGWGTAFQDVGSFLGMLTFTMIAAFLSRRLAFLLALLLSMFVTMFVFQSLNSASDAYWMLPMMGFAQLAVFAGYSIYFPGALSDHGCAAPAWASVTTRCDILPRPRRR